MAASCSFCGRTSGQTKCVIDSLKAGREYRLCDQVLTSAEALDKNITDSTMQSYDRETTSLEEVFLYPDADLKDFDQAGQYCRRYNIAAVMNHVIQSDELFCRKSSERWMDVLEDSTGVFTKADTLAIIKEDIIPIPEDLLETVLPDPNDRLAANTFLKAYEDFDGNDEEGSPFDQAFISYSDYFDSLPQPYSEDLLDEFNQTYWDWLDKAQFVDEIDRIQRLRLKGDVSLSEKQLDHFRKVVESEKDIDRRTILALEYAKWDESHGLVLLGETLESGQYTRYLLEAWITWRSLVQMYYFGPSSFTVIPNNFYDMMRVKCMNTILRHMKDGQDRFDACLLDSMIMTQILHRQGSIAGNESMTILAELQSGMFVHPRVLEQE